MSTPSKRAAEREAGMYDEKSYDLAEYFLTGEEHTKADIAELAYVIQAAVEDWFTGREPGGSR